MLTIAVFFERCSYLWHWYALQHPLFLRVRFRGTPASLRRLHSGIYRTLVHQSELGFSRGHTLGKCC